MLPLEESTPPQDKDQENQQYNTNGSGAKHHPDADFLFGCEDGFPFDGGKYVRCENGTNTVFNVIKWGGDVGTGANFDETYSLVLLNQGAVPHDGGYFDVELILRLHCPQRTENRIAAFDVRTDQIGIWFVAAADR